MAALVEILASRGAVITGSDVGERFYTDEILKKHGIQALPFSETNITDATEYVVYSSAYSPEKNPDLAAAVRRGIPTVLYSDALGFISRSAYSCGICGVHGKTTTTGLAGTILRAAGFPAQVLAGSAINSFGGSCTMTVGHDYFVAETCEYQRHFMAFEPKKIVLTSVESDHQDCYPTYGDIRDAFVDYICKLPENGQLIYCADDAGAVDAAERAAKRRGDIQLVPYGENASGGYRLTFGGVQNGIQSFFVEMLGECKICVPGNHTVRDAVAAAALACELLRTDGKNPADYFDKIKAGIADYAGGKRRSEIVARAKTPAGQDVVFIDDYGHHPTAIRTTLAGYREFYRNHEIIVDFMSHTYTRTAALLEEFAASFADADHVIINKIYGSAREAAGDASVSGEILAEAARKYHSDVVYAGEFDAAAETGFQYLSKKSRSSCPDGYLFVTMGAGDNWKVGRKILDMLGAESRCRSGE